jgi:hypothetical protein
MVDGPNLYQYCLNDPVNWVDPWGLCKQKKDVPWWVWGGLIGATIEPTPYGEVIAYPIATKYLIEAGIITAAVYQATRKHPLWRELTEITQVPKTYPYISTDPSKDPRFDPGKGWRRTMWWVLQIMRIWKNIAGSGQ